MTDDRKGYPRQINDAYELLPLDAVKPHPRNPRRGDLDAIKASMDVNGFYGAIVANKRTGYILAGNHRWMAARMLELPEIPVLWVDVGEAEARRILAADNRTGDLGGYDDAVLASLLQGLQDDGGLLGTGYSGDDIDELLSGLIDLDNDSSDEVPAPAIDKAKELQSKWKTARGQIWQVGAHRLMCGDCRNSDDLAELLQGKRPQWVFTDPPFDIDDLATLDELLRRGLRGAFLVAPDRLMGRFLRMTALELSMFFVWLVRLDLRMGGDDCYTGHLLCARLSDRAGAVKSNKHTGGFTTTMDSKYRARLAESVMHKHAKDLESVQLVIQNHGERGDLIFDPFAGSGTTALACERSGRSCASIEINPAYLAVQLERFADAGLTPSLVEGAP